MKNNDVIATVVAQYKSVESFINVKKRAKLTWDLLGSFKKREEEGLKQDQGAGGNSLLNSIVDRLGALFLPPEEVVFKQDE